MNSGVYKMTDRPQNPKKWEAVAIHPRCCFQYLPQFPRATVLWKRRGTK